MMLHPDNDELEISVFGPGIGECVAIHLGNREWIIVDSCCSQDNEPAVIKYFKKIGVNLSTEVRLVVSSHWHDDHIKGLSKIFSECNSAQFTCAVALRQREFSTLVSAYGNDPMIKHKGVEEFYKIFKIMQSLPPNDPRRIPIWALENRDLMCKAGHYTIKSLSPSDEAISQSIKDISALLPKPHETKRTLISENANHAAVVLHASVGVWNVLLASDLQITSNPLMGWSAIVNSKGRSTSKAHLVKIPHHGSSNGDSPEMWTHLVINRPIGIVTPYNRGSQKLPSDKDLQRLSEKCGNLFYTNVPTSSMPKRRIPAVERTIKMISLNRRVVKYEMGHVRLRTNIHSSTGLWKENMSGNAGQFLS